jgi:hypothetical protein
MAFVGAGTRNRHVCLAVVMVFFLAMGLVSLARPQYTLHFFGAKGLTADMRNEVRAVYGGFGVAIAVLLWHTVRVERRQPAYALGIRTAVMIALVGMAAGRVVSFGLEGIHGPYPLAFAAVELALAFLLNVAMPESGLTAR